jgi:hypothetical protein
VEGGLGIEAGESAFGPFSPILMALTVAAQIGIPLFERYNADNQNQDKPLTPEQLAKLDYERQDFESELKKLSESKFYSSLVAGVQLQIIKLHEQANALKITQDAQTDLASSKMGLALAQLDKEEQDALRGKSAQDAETIRNDFEYKKQKAQDNFELDQTRNATTNADEERDNLVNGRALEQSEVAKANTDVYQQTYYRDWFLKQAKYLDVDTKVPDSERQHTPWGVPIIVPGQVPTLEPTLLALQRQLAELEARRKSDSEKAPAYVPGETAQMEIVKGRIEIVTQYINANEKLKAAEWERDEITRGLTASQPQYDAHFEAANDRVVKAQVDEAAAAIRLRAHDEAHENNNPVSQSPATPPDPTSQKIDSISARIAQWQQEMEVNPEEAPYLQNLIDGQNEEKRRLQKSSSGAVAPTAAPYPDESSQSPLSIQPATSGPSIQPNQPITNNAPVPGAASGAGTQADAKELSAAAQALEAASHSNAELAANLKGILEKAQGLENHMAELAQATKTANAEMGRRISTVEAAVASLKSNFHH